MYKGFILSESLENPTILNDFNKIYVKIEQHPELEEYPFWHLFKVEVNDIEASMESISKELKYGWYAHFWDKDFVYVAFPNKYFKIPREERWASSDFKEAVAYGEKNGVESAYLQSFSMED